ncbi:flagellar basal-body MS-ring/collar protein FliF [Paradesulfitobacterium aromaticivorans]
MDFSWGGMQKSVREFWQKLSRPQKIITIVAPLLVATALFGLIIWAGQPNYVSIYKGTEAEAGAIRNKLVDLKFKYQLADGGTNILVPQAQAAEARLQLAVADLPQGSKFSYDYLNQMRIGETDADRKLRQLLGLQNELETTIKTLAGVQDSRVHIVMPEKSLFVENEKKATAAVTLKLAPGTKLGDDQIRGIANLMAASVEGLEMQNVTVMDTNGSVLSDVLGNSNDPNRLTGTQLQLKQTVENNIQKSVQSMLDRVFPGQTVVRANVTLNFDQVSVKEQQHGPGAVVSKETSTETSTNGSAVGTVPGPNTNIPGYPAPTASGTPSSSNSSKTTENFQVDVTQTERIINPGSISRLSVSVMLDGETVTQAQADQIKEVVASAAGIDVNRGDQIQIAAIPFDKQSLMAEKAAMAQAEQKQKILTYAELGAGVLLGILFLLILWRARSKYRQGGSLALAGSFEPVPLAAAEELLLSQRQAEAEAKFKIAQKQAKSADEIEKQKVKEAVELYTRNNPDEVARLVKTWLSEDR